MNADRKKYIALKTLKARAEIFSRMLKKPDNLTRISQAADITPDQVQLFFNQFLGKSDIAFKKEEASDIAWIMMRAMLRDGLLNDGLKILASHIESAADTLGISVEELNEFFREDLCDIITELFPP